MDLNDKRKKYVRTDRNTRSGETFALLDEVYSDQEEGIDNLMNDSDTEFIVDENFDNDVDSDDEPLTALIPEANIHVVKGSSCSKSSAEANMEKSNVECQKESKQKSKRKGEEKATKKKSVDLSFVFRK